MMAEVTEGTLGPVCVQEGTIEMRVYGVGHVRVGEGRGSARAEGLF
jgi:hypothetical protein